MGNHAAERRAKRRAVGGEHDDDEHHGVDQHAIIGKGAQQLGQNGQQRRGDDRAANVADAAQNDEHQHEDGGVKLELGGGDGGVIQSEQRAGHACEERGGHEGHHLVLGDVDAHGFGGDAAVADGHDGAAGAAVDEVQNHKQGEQNQREADDEGGDLGHARGAGRGENLPQAFGDQNPKSS